MAQEWYQYPVTRGFTWLWDAIVRHSGIDYGAPCGTPLTSPVDGTILNSGVKPWGGQIDILAPDLPGYETGPHVVTFLHSSEQYKRAGEKVQKGEVIGASGQPPPGAPQYGSGCHVHFEVTHGSTAPYTTYSPSRNPSNTGSYPESPAPLISNLHGGGIGARAKFAQADCGPEPLPSDPDYQNKLIAWLECQGKIPTPGSGTYGQTPIEAIGSGITGIAGFFSALPGQLAHQAMRWFKVVLGAGFLLVGVVLAFLPDIGAGVAVAAGAPEFAGAIRQATRGGPKGAVQGGIRGLSLIPGRQRAATRAKVREQRATAHAYAIEQQAAARRVERANRTTAKLLPTAGPDMRGGRASGQPEQPSGLGTIGTRHAGVGGAGTRISQSLFKRTPKAPKPPKPAGKDAADEVNDLLRDIAGARAEQPDYVKEGVARQEQAKKIKKERHIRSRTAAKSASPTRQAHGPRQPPSVQLLPAMAEAAIRKTKRGIKAYRKRRATRHPPTKG